MRPQGRRPVVCQIDIVSQQLRTRFRVHVESNISEALFRPTQLRANTLRPARSTKYKAKDMDTLSRREEDALLKSTKERALRECDGLVKGLFVCLPPHLALPFLLLLIQSITYSNHAFTLTNERTKKSKIYHNGAK